MPKRMIDGEALWSSNTLKLMPKADCLAVLIYAWLLPLAEGNGVFEYNPEAILIRTMSYHDILDNTNELETYLELYRDYGLLFVWEHEGKQLGFWVNMEKRLPTPKPTIRFRFPNPPQEQLQDYIKEAKSRLFNNVYQNVNPPPRGLGLEVGLGVGLGFSHTPSNGQENLGDGDMSFKNNITDKAREILKVRIFPGDQGWDEMTSLKRVYGAVLVEQTFVDWARTIDEDITYPLTAFLRVADSWISGNYLKDEAKPLILDLAVLSDGAVLFSQKQSLEIGRLLANYPEADIKAAFVEFLEGLDDHSIKFASKDFSERAPQLLYARKQRQLKQEQTEKLVEDTIAQQRAKAEAEIATQPKPIDFENFQF